MQTQDPCIVVKTKSGLRRESPNCCSGLLVFNVRRWPNTHMTHMWWFRELRKLWGWYESKFLLLIISNRSMPKILFRVQLSEQLLMLSFLIAYANPVLKGLHRKPGQYASVRKLRLKERHILNFLGHGIFVYFITLGIFCPSGVCLILGQIYLKPNQGSYLCSCPILFSQPEWCPVIWSLCPQKGHLAL